MSGIFCGAVFFDSHISDGSVVCGDVLDFALLSDDGFESFDGSECRGILSDGVIGVVEGVQSIFA